MIIAYDLGTGGNKASLYDVEGNCLAAVFVPYETQYPKAGWHEQRPEDWWKAIVESTRKLLAADGVDGRSVLCLAISGHSLGCVPLDPGGALLRESTPIWSDKRPLEQVDRFFADVDRTHWYQLTGNGFPAPHYTVFKIMWYRDNEPEMFSRIDKIVGTKDYINFRLTGEIQTDYSYASGSGIYDLVGWDYSDELLAAADLPRRILPKPVPSTEILGELLPEVAAELGLPKTVKVACGGVDNSCMALGARNISEGRTYTSLGSSTWIAVSSGQPLLDNRSKPFVFTHVVPKMFTSAIGIFSTGTSLKWVRDHLCANLLEEAERQGRDPYDVMTELAATSPAGANKLLFNPSLAGGSSLEPSLHIRGAFMGLDLGHTQADVVRATLEGIALNMRVALDEMRQAAAVSSEMVAVGGGSKSDFWLQMMADACGTKMVKTNIGQEAGSLGAAAVAAVGAGLWDDFERIDDIHKVQYVASPDTNTVKIYDKLLPVFRKAAEHQSRLGETLAELDI